MIVELIGFRMASFHDSMFKKMLQMVYQNSCNYRELALNRYF